MISVAVHFHQREHIHISFPLGRRTPESFVDKFSINLNSSWYTDKFMGFLICYHVSNPFHESAMYCKLSDRERKHHLCCCIRPYEFPHDAIFYVSYTYHLKYFGMLLQVKKGRTQMIIAYSRYPIQGLQHVGEFTWSMRIKDGDGEGCNE